MDEAEKKIRLDERWRAATFLRSRAADATERAAAWERRGHEGMASTKEREAELAVEWAKALEAGDHE